MTDESGTCPVCGWAYLSEDHIPQNPEHDHGPDAPGTYYVHRWESIGAGRVEIAGCSKYANGETDAWEPTDRGEK